MKVTTIISKLLEGISALFDDITILHVSFGMPKFPVYRIDDRPTSSKFTSDGIFCYKLQTGVFLVGKSDCRFITGNLKTLKYFLRYVRVYVTLIGASDWFRLKGVRKGLIPRQRNSSQETVYAKYGWLGMNDSIEFSHFFRLRSE